MERYLLAHIDAEGDYLYHPCHAINTHTVCRRMVSGYLQGRPPRILVEVIRPKSILEVSTFNGYSVIRMAGGLGEDGQLYTLEVNDEVEDFTRPWIEDSPAASGIQFIIGDADVKAPKLNVVFSMAFVGGDKRTYIEAFETVLKLLRPGRFVLVDNALWDGRVIDPHYQHDQQTQGIVRFNDFITQDAQMEKVTLPIRDGSTIIRKRLNK